MDKTLVFVDSLFGIHCDGGYLYQTLWSLLRYEALRHWRCCEYDHARGLRDLLTFLSILELDHVRMMGFELVAIKKNMSQEQRVLLLPYVEKHLKVIADEGNSHDCFTLEVLQKLQEELRQ